MHIVLILPTYYPDTHGGAERQTRILAQAMRSQGATATILAPTCVASAAGVSSENGVEVVRIHVRHLPFLGGRYVVSMLHWWWAAFRWLARNRDRYQVISVQHVRLHAAPGIMAGMLFRKVLSGKLGRGGPHFDMRRLRKQKLPFGRLTVFLAKRSTLVFAANSVEICDDLKAEGVADTRIFRVPNGVETPAEAGAAYRDEEGRPVFVFAGRLEEEKGLLPLIEAFRLFREGGQDARLRIFGGGPLREQLELLIPRAGLSGAVTLDGTTDNRDEIYGGAAFMILPSESEGMSNTLLEAMAYGAVPIITAVSGARDVVDDPGTGLVLRDNSVEAILDGLGRAAAMSRETWAAVSHAARARMVRDYSITTVARSYLALYERLLRQPSRGSNGPMAREQRAQ